MNDTPIYIRNVESRILEAQQDTPVVLIAGPRQAGKTTLVRQLAQQQGLQYLTLDDELTLLSAQNDPIGLIRTIDSGVIDEIQRAPQLLLAIKQSVDEDRRSGRFLLTGSANIMALPTVADSLAGRMETLALLPLSQSEMESQVANWIDSVFAGRFLVAQQPSVGDDLVQRVLRGGYPEAVARATARRRTVWAQQYIDALIQRDVRDIANIEKLDQLPRFLRALAQMAGQMCNYSQLGAQIGLDGKTVSRYIGVLEHMYLLKRVDVWARNQLKRVVKSSKLQFIDSGLLATVLGVSHTEVVQDRTRFGNLLETFVYGELCKHISTAETSCRLLYYRDADKYEVDFVIENSQNDIIGIEVKAAASVQEKDLRGLKKLAGLAGEQFKMGIILYDGMEIMPLGNKIFAVPLSSLWGEVL